MSEIAKLWVTLEARSETFFKDMTVAEKKFENTRELADKIGGSMKTLGLVMASAGGAIVASMGLAVNSLTKTGDQFDKMSLRTGVSTKALQEFGYAFKLSGGSIEEFEVGLKKMAMTITDAGDGIAMAKLSLEKLNLRFSDLKNMTPEEQFTALSNAIADIENPTERAAAAVDIFGRSGTSLLPMLSSGREGIANLRKEASIYGTVLDDETIKKTVQWNDDLDRLKGGLLSVGHELAKVLLPSIIDFGTKAKEILVSVKDWIKNNQNLFNGIIKLTATVSLLMIGLGSVIFIVGQAIISFSALQIKLAAIKSIVALLIPQLTAMQAAMAVGTILTYIGVLGSLIFTYEMLKKTVIGLWQALKNENLEIQKSINLQNKLQTKMTDGINIWKKYGDTSRTALLQSGITANEAKSAYEGMFSLSSKMHGEEKKRWEERARLYKSVYQTLTTSNKIATTAEINAAREKAEKEKEYETALLNYQVLTGQKSLQDKINILKTEILLISENNVEKIALMTELHNTEKELEDKRKEEFDLANAHMLEMELNLTMSTQAAFENLFTNIGTGWQTLSDFMNNIWTGLRDSIIRVMSEIAAKWLVQNALMKVATLAWKAIEIGAAAAVAAARAAAASSWSLWGSIAIGAAIGAAVLGMARGFESGGIVGGSSYAGDHVMAAVNSGEMILNHGQQAQLFAIANGKSGGRTQQTIQIFLDGKQIARTTAKNLPEVLKLYGV
jgi:hypothetical protein